MKVINAGLILIIVAIGFFTTDNLKLKRISQTMFERVNTNINLDAISTDALGEAIAGIDERGEVIVSLKRSDVIYTGLVSKNLQENATDSTAFMLYTGNNMMNADFGEYFEKEICSQIKTVNKKLNYSFLFTEKTNSFFYNPVCNKSLYIMYLPKLANLIRVKANAIVYTLSGAKID